MDGSQYNDETDYVTISTTGNSTDFGELITARYGCTSASNGINERALTSGGAISGTLYGVIEYNTINSPGTAVDFGDMSYEAQNPGSLSNGAL